MYLALGCDQTSFFYDVCQATAGKFDKSGLIAVAIDRVLGPAAVLVAIVVWGRWLRRGFERSRLIRRDPQVATLIHNVTTATTYVLALLIALVTAGLSPALLVTFAGLGSLAIGLAFQDVLRNLLAGIFLLLEQPFKIGDAITVAEQSGVVETIQLRTTALRTFDNRLAIVPNLTAFNSTVVNETAFATRRFTVTLAVPRDRPLAVGLRQVREQLTTTQGLQTTPAPAIQPHIHAEEVLLDCSYWLDYRTTDPDGVAADLATRLADLGRWN